MFDKSVYVGRRKELLTRMTGSGATGIAIFLGNVDAAAQYKDNCYKFRQDSNWIYFFGLDEPRMAAIIDLETGRETIYADDVDIDDIIWTGPMPSVASEAGKVGVSNSAPYSQWDRDVLKAREAGRQIHFLPASRYYNMMKLSSLLGLSPEEVVSKGKKGCEKASEAFVKAVVAMRLVKTPEEIACIDAACNLGQQMHTLARNATRLGVVEQRIVGAMEGLALGKGWGLSFATILTQHGEIFHCHSHNDTIEDGRLLVIDAGVEANDHYASDFTRTLPTGGHFTDKQRDIYQIVADCNELAFSMIRPGVTYRSVHIAVARFMLERLGQLGLVHGDLDEMVAQGVAGLFMPHGLGHNMGLDVHDMEDLGEDIVGYDGDQTRSPQLGLGSLRMARRLVPGNVITDEPGIYFIPALIEQWNKEGIAKDFVNFELLAREYYDFGGIRLEDDVLVTESGARRLGSDRLPIQPQDVEDAMRL